jgi:hypothetical protein
LHFALFFKGFSLGVSSLLWPMTPISSTFPMLFLSPLINLRLSWFLWGYSFNPTSVRFGLHLAYLLGLSLMPSWWHQNPWCPFWFCLLFFIIFIGGSRQRCSTCRNVFQIKVCLGDIWYFLLMFHLQAFFFLCCFPPFQVFETNLLFFTPP